MASPAYRLPSPYEQVPLRQRAGGLSLTLALNLFLLFLLLGIASRPLDIIKDQAPTVFDLSPTDTREESTEEPKPKPQQRQEQARPKVQQPKIILPVPPTIAPPPALDMLELTKEELKSTDQALASSTANGGNSGGEDSPIVGRGPNGQALYAAEWVREPTNQELNGYANSRTGPGIGTIACKTYPGFRVDDCVSLGSQPVSARLDKLLLAAAWQFKVRPPRKDGKLMVGEWVNIQLTYGMAEER